MYKQSMLSIVKRDLVLKPFNQ